MPSPDWVGPITTAPAPSPNSIPVFLSLKSVMRVSFSAPISSTRSARPTSISAAHCESPARKPVQAAPMSNAAARSAPSAWATSGAQFGVISSALMVATITKSRSRAFDARVLQRLAGGEHGHVGRALVGRGAAAGVDARALDDPVVVDADALGDLGVRNDLRGQVVTEPEDRGGARGRGAPPVARGVARDLMQLWGERCTKH